MDKLIAPGRIFYASYGMLFGIQTFIYGTFIAALIPDPKWISSSPVLTSIIGAVVLVIALALVVRIKGQFAATLLAVFYFIVVLVLHLPRLLADIHNPQEWTVVGEMLALCTGGLIAGTLLPTDIWDIYGLPDRRHKIQRVAILVFAATLLIFAALHFMYAEFISYLIPNWIPFRMFWSYFVGVAFLATAVSIVINVKAKLAASMLGVMFFLLFILEHAPRVIAHPGVRDEWSSAFIALAMAGISFMIAPSFESPHEFK